MKAIRLAWQELRRFRGPVRRLVPVVLILVPTLYGALYLWANWDPYGRMNRIPVAVVNSDRPVSSNGERVNAGEQLVQQLKATDTFDWHFVDEREAHRGLVEGNYYFTVSVPSDFSAKLAAATQNMPERAAIEVTKNDANGYIAGIMADTAKYRLQNQVNAAAHTAYARALYGELGRARDTLLVASETSHQLVEGTELSKQATAALTGGLNGIRDGSGRITRGVQDVSDATARLDDQLSSVTGFAARELPGAVDSLVDESNGAVNSLGTIATTTEFTRVQANRSATALTELGEQHPDLLQAPAYRRALDDARGLASATATSDREAQRALRTAQDANDRALALRSEVGSLQDRVRTIDAPLNNLRSGTAELAAGTREVTGGLSSLAAGSGVLETSAGQLNDGARRLNDLVDDSLNRIPPTNPTEVARASDVLGSPSEIRTSNLNPAEVYGRGLAPFFFAIALWVFGLLAYLLLKPINERALGSRVNAGSIMMAGFLPAAALGVIGGLVLLGVADLALGLDPEHLLWTVGLIALGVSAFVAIDQFLRASLGAIGALLSMVLLVVQLTASGGIFPMETTPVAFQAVHPFLPMTYLVDGLRVTISGGEAQHLLHDAVVLGGVLLAFLIMTTIVAQAHRTWSMRRLRPQVAL
ncbi:YhgE/Pip family protein [Parasphingorhabdus pacifica]